MAAVKEPISHFDPDKPECVQRLARAVDYSWRSLEPFRKNEANFKRHYVGRHYTDKGSKVSVPDNLIEKHVNILLRALVPSTPAAFVRTGNPGLRAKRGKLELALNNLFKEIDLRSDLQAATFDAMFQCGVMKVGLNECNFASKGYLHDVGQPFADFILLGDWVHDMTARRWEAIDFCGNRFQATLDEAREFPGLGRGIIDQIAKHGGEGGMSIEPRADDIQTRKGAYEARDGRIRDYFNFWDLWLPKENLMVVLWDDGQSAVPWQSKVIAYADWNGPEHGPYRRLGFGWIPGMTMPLSPIAVMYELAMFANALARKASRQAENQKTVLGARRGSVRDAERLAAGGDLQVVPIDDPNSVKDYRFNGADPQTVQMWTQARQLYSANAGNLDVIGGISSQAETLGQERLLDRNASTRVNDMQDKVFSFVKGVMEDLAYWLYTDPITTLPLTKRAYDAEYTVLYTPEDREADFLQYEIEINPYSLQSRTPSEEFQLMTQVLMLYQQMRADAMQQGATLDVPKMLRRMSELTNFKSLDDFIMFTGETAPPESVTSVAPPRPQTVQVARPDGRAESDRLFQNMAGLMAQASGEGRNGRGSLAG